MTTLQVILWNAFLLVGCAYLVHHGWSAWWFALAIFLLAS